MRQVLSGLAWGIHLVTPRPDYRMRNGVSCVGRNERKEADRYGIQAKVQVQLTPSRQVTPNFPRDTYCVFWSGREFALPVFFPPGRIIFNSIYLYGVPMQ